jgi:hypothetical protein
VGHVRRIGAVLGPAILIGSVTAFPSVLPAAAAGTVGPHQYFTGVVNGHDGNTTTPITIRMACPTPLTQGETGHPLPGQTLAVHQEFPPAAAGGLGQTGSDTEIGFFTALPPTTPAAGTTTPVFKRYDVSKPLPTALTLPCTGTGTVYFVPIPVVPPSRSQSVPVAFRAKP